MCLFDNLGWDFWSSMVHSLSVLTTACKAKGAFQCANGICIPGESKCDGVPSCGHPDYSDEKDCGKSTLQSVTLRSMFHCLLVVALLMRFECTMKAVKFS